MGVKMEFDLDQELVSAANGLPLSEQALDVLRRDFQLFKAKLPWKVVPPLFSEYKAQRIASAAGQPIPR
jgi:hypothetical protein